MRHAEDGRSPDEGQSRREFIALGAAFGVGGLPGLWRGAPAPADAAPAQAVIQIFLRGGMSHIDTFDPKPDQPVEVRGPFGTVPAKIDGERFSSLLRRTARVADRLVVIRSMTHGEAAHERGVHNMLTGNKPSPAIAYPSMGAVVSHELGGRNDLPPYVCVPSAAGQFLGTGYLSSAFGPFSLGSEPSRGNYKVRDLTPSGSVDEQRIARRRRILLELDGSAEGMVGSSAVEATEAFYQQAWRMIESEPAQEAFRIDREPKKLRDRYGRTAMGQRLLLARRLAQAGVRYVTVLDGGYDHHRNISSGLRGRLGALDRAFEALIVDLEASGLLDSTLVVLTTEFGRTPRINRTRGRDHWPKAFSTVLAGGGLRRGLVVGRTDPTGAEPVDAPVTPADLAATVLSQLGIDPEKRLISPSDRPIDIVRAGRVLREILV